MATESISSLKKTCTKCGREFPATTEYFRLKKHGKYGLEAQCRECRDAYFAHYRDTHKEYEHARHMAYETAHREQRQVYFASHRQEKREYMVQYSSEHREEKRAYRASPRGKMLDHAAIHRRRARKKGNGGSYTPADLEAVLKAHTNKRGQIICALCGKPIKGKYHVDHFIPLSQGGSNDAGNLRIMHGKCNQIKHAKLPAQLGLLI